MGVLKKYGAGVIGSLYAAKLIKRGHDVTILARGERLSELSRYGLVIEHAITWVIERYEVKTIGIPITPGKINFFVLPNAILVPLFRRLLSGKIAETVMERHALAAGDEMESLSRERS